MPKSTSSSASGLLSGRKQASQSSGSGEAKKRKTPAVDSPAGGKSSSLMLNDILSGLDTSSKGKKRAEADDGPVSVRKKPKTSGGTDSKRESQKAKGGSMSAIDLLMGGTSFGNAGEIKAKKAKRPDAGFEAVVTKTGKGLNDAFTLLSEPSSGKERHKIASSRSIQDVSSSSAVPTAKPIKKKSSTSEQQPSSATPQEPGPKATASYKAMAHPKTLASSAPASMTTDMTATASQRPPSTPLETTPPSATPAAQPHELQTRQREQLDLPVLLKTFKASHRALAMSLAALQDELVLVDRVWYKNRSQFKSAFWWNAFNSLRRCSHAFLDSLGGLNKSDLAVLYAGLGGGREAFEAERARKLGSAQGGAPTTNTTTLMKFDTRPTIEALQDLMQLQEARELLSETSAKLREAASAAEEVVRRSESAGKVLVKHLNTPPAPTFAPLITTLLALVASVHSITGQVLAPSEVDAIGKEQAGPLKTLQSLLDQSASLGALRHSYQEK